VTAAISALRKLSAAAPYEISAAHGANSASANARLSTAEPAAADAHTPSRATHMHAAATAAAKVHATTAAAADMHATSATAHTASTTVHTASPTATVHTASTTAAPLGEGRGCNC
jgi:hypothetical protein